MSYNLAVVKEPSCCIKLYFSFFQSISHYKNAFRKLQFSESAYKEIISNYVSAVIN